MKTGIVNYGLGNIGSLKNMLTHIGGNATVVESSNEIRLCDKIILPGVGNFGTAMKKIMEIDGLCEELKIAAIEKQKPFLGICLGMQMLFDYSEEGKSYGLSLVEGKVNRLNPTVENKVPNMGWSLVKRHKKSSLTKNFSDNERFYFVHSFFCTPKNSSDILMTAKHEIDFCCGVEHNNIFGVQFHPEKSHLFGMKLLANFLDL